MNRHQFFSKAAIVAVTGVLLWSSDAAALNFSPTEKEWATWPDYCRARYVVSGAGNTSEYAGRIPSAEVRRQENVMGAGWNWLHHYCAGKAYLSRSKEAPNERRKEFWLDEAEANIMGYFRRLQPGSPMLPIVSLDIADVYRGRGNNSKALAVLRETIERFPTAGSSYAMISMIHREAGNSEEAIAVLQEGNEATGGTSAELHYFLGLIFVEQGDLDSAADHAKLAYNFGYPLPGLARKLQRQGVSLN